MAVAGGTQVKLNQCLFGYDEGHRLLAASQKLPEEAASLLLPHSDLVPGLPSTGFKSYWTGIPVPSLKAYALMQTWPAPEMPRPGCVWTHVLLIGFADMARMSDLGALRAHLLRPAEAVAYTAYMQPILADAESTGHPRRALAARSGLLVLRSLYGEDTNGILGADGYDIDDTIFAAWSQQWPRLRRSLSFRTARPGIESTSRVRFDLRLIGDASAASTQGDANEQTEDWERVALDDLLVGPSEFRRFLWRYGADQSRGRERFRFLAKLYASTRSKHLTGHELWSTLEQVTEVLPNQADGKLLKEDLLSAGQSSYSLLPASDPLDVLDFFANGADRGGLPPPPEATFDAVHNVWAEQPARILSIAERAVRQESPVAAQVLERLAAVAVPATFLSLTSDHPMVRSRIVEANPPLLDSPGLLQVDQPYRNELMSFVADGDLAGRIVTLLVGVNDPEAARVLTSRFPEVVESHVLEAVTEWIAGRGPFVPGCWQDSLRMHGPSGLTGRLLGRVTSTTGLAACSVLLQLDVRAGLSETPAAWAETLVRVRDDVRGEARQRLLAYLLSLALAEPMRGCEPLFERSFEPVYADLSSSRLPQDASETLVRVLPNIYWWQQWDTCLRLQHGAVNAYVNANLDPHSFRRLTRDEGLFKRLVELADDSKQGRRFIKQVVA